MTREFEHYEGCGRNDPDNCSGCALTDLRQDRPNYAAWPLAYMENRRAIPVKWRPAFMEELASPNRAYADNLVTTARRYTARFSDGSTFDGNWRYAELAHEMKLTG